MAQGTKDRLLTVSAMLFQRQGLAGTGIKQILAEADAPFSSLYHHFPGGKDELAAQAIRSSGAGYQLLVEEVWDVAPDVSSAVGAVFDGAAETLEATDFADACPIATVAARGGQYPRAPTFGHRRGLRGVDRRSNPAASIGRDRRGRGLAGPPWP